MVSGKNIKNKLRINIIKILSSEQTELKHLSQLLIVYGLLLAEKKLIYIQTVKTCFNYNLRKNIYLIVNYYMKPEITILNLSEEDEEEEESNNSEDLDISQDENNLNKNSLDPKIIKRKKELLEVKKMEREIEAKASDLTLKFGVINSKIKII